MRVLFVSTYPHLPDIVGGLQTTTHDLCLAIRAMGAEAAVLCGQATAATGDTEASLTQDEHLGYPVLRSPRPVQALPAAAARFDADVIVVQSGTTLAPLVLASLDTGRPTAVYMHNVETSQLGGHLVADPSLLYLANSDFTAQRWHALYGLDCAVIPPSSRRRTTLQRAPATRCCSSTPRPSRAWSGCSSWRWPAPSCPSS
ncbi:glycosyltransferase [Hydrogenophaga sp. ANAO-22]|uniref:glycosyltransferase n=1 Tax=Hydrogenophaga sp. ANAO-22 TaxID=3166645 RepID=UPI0036D364DA